MVIKIYITLKGSLHALFIKEQMTTITENNIPYLFCMEYSIPFIMEYSI